MVMVLQNTKEKEKSLKAGSEKRQITYKKKKKKRQLDLQPTSQQPYWKPKDSKIKSQRY